MKTDSAIMRTATENMRTKTITILPIPLIVAILLLCSLTRFHNFSPLQLSENTIEVSNEYHIAERISVKATCKKLHFNYEISIKQYCSK